LPIADTPKYFTKTVHFLLFSYKHIYFFKVIDNKAYKLSNYIIFRVRKDVLHYVTRDLTHRRNNSKSILNFCVLLYLRYTLFIKTQYILY
jgi:hypothetical protein